MVGVEADTKSNVLQGRGGEGGSGNASIINVLVLEDEDREARGQRDQGVY